MTAPGPASPQASRGSVAHGARAARGIKLREGSQSLDLGAYALPQLGRALALRSLVGLTGEGAENRLAWVHVAYPGEWLGHPEGAFTLDRAAFESCVRAFESQVNPVPMDFEHSSVRDVPDAPAAGWVQKLELRGDDLWALVEFTKRAAQMVRDGEYRFCSGVFVFDKPDRKSGEPVACAVHSVALTNTPFVDGQKPIALSQRRVVALSGGKMEIERGAFEEALKKLEGDKFTAEQLKSLIASVAAMAAAQDPEGAEVEVEVEEPGAASAGDMPPAEVADLKSDEKADAKNENGADKKALADAPVPPPADAAPMADAPPADPAALMAKLEELAAMAGMGVADLMAKLEEMIASGGAQGNPAAMSDDARSLSVRADAQAVTIRTLSERLRKYEDAERAAKKAAADAKRAALDADVESLVASGVVLKADADKLRALAHRDESAYRDMVAVLRNRPAVPTGRGASAARVEAAGDQSLDVMIDMSRPEVRALSDSLKRFGLSDEQVQKRVREHLGRTVSAG